jgi:hypothetical protein
VETVSATFNYATNKATCVVKVIDNGGCALTQRGICWSTKRNPTTADNVFASGISVGQFYAQTGTLDLNKIYYIRSFATNCMGTTYGNEMTVQALMGNVTYTLAQDVINAGERTHNLIKTAMDSACYYKPLHHISRQHLGVLQCRDPNSSGLLSRIDWFRTERTLYVGRNCYARNGALLWFRNNHHMEKHDGGWTWQGAVAKALCLQLTDKP